MEAAVARSAYRVPHSRIRELAELAMSMSGVYRLYFGESTLPTPPFIKRAAERALADGHTFYTENAGTPSLRAAIARYYARIHGVAIDPAAEVVVTASGVQALNVAVRCVLDPGDRALVLTPAWPNGSAIVGMCNATPVEVPLSISKGRYTVDFEVLEEAGDDVRLLIYTSPSNPLGWVATEDEQRRLLEFTRRRRMWLLADEVYERLNYSAGGANRPAPSILRLATRDDSVIAVQSFSKSYCMTGWRLGWLVARGDLVDRATKLNEFIVSHATTFVQKAGEIALDEGEEFIAEMHARMMANRALATEALRGLPGVVLPEPEGAFYLFPRIDAAGDSFDYCRRLLLETKVGLAPGVAFGAGGEGSVRLCYAAERSVLEPALELLAKFIRRG